MRTENKAVFDIRPISREFFRQRQSICGTGKLLQDKLHRVPRDFIQSLPFLFRNITSVYNLRKKVFDFFPSHVNHDGKLDKVLRLERGIEKKEGKLVMKGKGTKKKR